QRGKPPEWWEKQKGSRGIRRGQWYRLVFQFPIREQGRNLLRGREALPAQPENPLSARSGIGFVDGRQSRYGKSPDDSPHDSPAIRLVT
ncbi:hypothetical protein JEJ92_28140, partial [Klebsiella pneumoniae]|uniref:hypothetical protein n=1 Tax=Klebsiella pneumoniae TaxID=573 RepID=UPI00211795B1